jgi:hypothetical protein
MVSNSHSIIGDAWQWDLLGAITESPLSPNSLLVSKCLMTKGELNVRSEPEGQSITKLNAETKLTTTDKEQNGWLEISAPKKGWVYQKYTQPCPEVVESISLTPTTASSATLTPTSTPALTPTPSSISCLITVIHPFATFSESPSHSAREMGGVKMGKYGVIDNQLVSWAGRDEMWYKISHNSRLGWIADSSILIGEKTGSCP